MADRKWSDDELLQFLKVMAQGEYDGGVDEYGDQFKAAAQRIEAMKAHCERQEEALHQIKNWAEAYPLDMFPEPDFEKAADVLKANGMTLDSISASNMRHVVEGVGKIARAALQLGEHG